MNVLVFASHAAALSEYQKLFDDADGIKAFLYENDGSGLLSECNSSAYQKNYVSKLVSRGRNRNSRWAPRIKKLLDDTYLGCLAQHYIFSYFLRKRLTKLLLNEAEKIIDLIDRYSISAIIIQSDRSLGVETSALLAAKRKNIKAYLLSFAYSADYKSSYKLRSSRIYSFLSRHPKNVVYHDEVLGGKAFYRLFESQALDKLGVLSSDPWVLGAGSIDRMLLDSDREKARIVSLGGREEDYVVTGTKSQDDLYCRFQKVQYNKNEPRDKFVVVVALPQYYEHGLCDQISHVKHVRGLLEAVKRNEYRVLVSLHPKMNRADYSFVESEFGFLISDYSVAELLPEADIFIATYSSTVSWAILCGVQVVICDHIGLDYTDFYSEFSLPLVKNNIDLKKVVENYFLSINHLSSYPSELVRRLAPFDGKSQQRILNCLKGVADEN